MNLNNLIIKKNLSLLGDVQTRFPLPPGYMDMYILLIYYKLFFIYY